MIKRRLMIKEFFKKRKIRNGEWIHMRMIGFTVLVFFSAFVSTVALAEGIKIGTLLAHTGALKEMGSVIQNGVVLAAKQLTAAGLEIELVHEDSQTSVEPAIKAAKKLVAQDNVVAVVGALASGVTASVAEQVTGPNDVLLVSPASTSPLLTGLPADKKKDYLFRTCPSDSLQGVISGMLAAGKYRTASIMYVDNPYGQGIAGQFKRTFEELGGNVLTMVAHDEKPAKSYSTELKSALAKFYLPKPTLQGKPGDYVNSLVLPEMLCVFSYTGQAKIYVKEAIESFKYKNFLFSDGSKSEDLIKAVGAQNLEGMMGTSPAPGQGEPYILYNIYYNTEFGKIPPPLPFISNAYDATAVIGLAAYAAKAKRLPLTGKNIRDQLRLVGNPPGEFIKPGEFKRAFELLDQGKEINYEGASGSVDFDQNGDVVAPIEVWKYSGGKIVTIRIEYYISEK